MLRFIDSHIHLADPEFEELMGQLNTSAERLSIALVAVSMGVASSKKTLLEVAHTSSAILPFVGIHPWLANEASTEQFDLFMEESKGEVVGIGEIGLDGKYGGGEEAQQRQVEVFEKMLVWAEGLGKPVSVHSRASQDRVLDVLGSYDIKSVLLHWFSGDLSQLGRAVDRGYFVSFGPTVVYSKKSIHLAEACPKQSALTETDGPVTYDACFEGKVAVPAFIPSVAFAIGQVWKMDFDEVVETIWRNAEDYLGKEAMTRTLRLRMQPNT